MKSSTKTILDELTNGLPERNRSLLIESRANHIITGAINLITSIEEQYGPKIAEELERRLLNSIRGRDTEKFARAARRLK